MSSGDVLPNEHHIGRLCRGSSLDEDGNPTGASFMPRDGEEYLSVNWLELLDANDRENALRLLKPVLSAKMKISSTWKLATLNVGQCKAGVSEATNGRIEIQIAHEPVETDTVSDPSHSGIFNHENDEAAIEKLAEAVIATCAAK